jgi:hypothetical protein
MPPSEIGILSCYEVLCDSSCFANLVIILVDDNMANDIIVCCPVDVLHQEMLCWGVTVENGTREASRVCIYCIFHVFDICFSDF